MREVRTTKWTGNVNGACGTDYFKVSFRDLLCLLVGGWLVTGSHVFYLWGKHPDKPEHWGWWRRRQERIKAAEAAKAKWQAEYDKMNDVQKSAVRHLVGAMQEFTDRIRCRSN